MQLECGLDLFPGMQECDDGGQFFLFKDASVGRHVGSTVYDPDAKVLGGVHSTGCLVAFGLSKNRCSIIA
jgi:hypothetical protein